MCVGSELGAPGCNFVMVGFHGSGDGSMQHSGHARDGNMREANSSIPSIKQRKEINEDERSLRAPPDKRTREGVDTAEVDLLVGEKRSGTKNGQSWSLRNVIGRY